MGFLAKFQKIQYSQETPPAKIQKDKKRLNFYHKLKIKKTHRQKEKLKLWVRTNE